MTTTDVNKPFAYLVDFGIVRAATGVRSSLTATGSAIGTLARFDTADEFAKAAQLAVSTPAQSSLPIYVPSRPPDGNTPPIPTPINPVHPVPTSDPPRRYGTLPIVLGAREGISGDDAGIRR